MDMSSAFAAAFYAFSYGVPLLGFILGPYLLEPASHRRIRALATTFDHVHGFSKVGEGHVTGRIGRHVASVAPSTPMPVEPQVRTWYLMAIVLAAVLTVTTTGLAMSAASLLVFRGLALAACWLVTLYVAAMTIPAQGAGLATQLSVEVGLDGLPDVSVRPYQRSLLLTGDSVFDDAHTVDGDDLEVAALLGPAQRLALTKAPEDVQLQRGDLVWTGPATTDVSAVEARMKEMSDLAAALSIPHDRSAAIAARFHEESAEAPRVIALDALGRHRPAMARKLAADVLASSSIADALSGTSLDKLAALILLEDSGLPSDIPAIDALREEFPIPVSKAIAAIRERVAPGAAGGITIANDSQRGGLTAAGKREGAITARPERH